jgi:uncharacterized protein (TIGR03067 family)
MIPNLKTLVMSAVVGLALGASAGGGVAKDDVAQIDLANLEGTWVRELDGKTYIFHFNGEKFASLSEFAEGITTTTGRFTIDPTTQPKHIDFTFNEGTGRGEKLKGKTALNIYQLDGDTLQICARRPLGRCAEFPSTEITEGEYIYLVLKRAR